MLKAATLGGQCTRRAVSFRDQTSTSPFLHPSASCKITRHSLSWSLALPPSARVPFLGRQGKRIKDVPEGKQGEASLTRQLNKPTNKRQEKHEISCLLLRRTATSQQQGQGHLLAVLFKLPYFRFPLCLSFPNRAKPTSNNTRQVLMQTLGKGEGHLTAWQHPKHTISNRKQGTGMRGTCRGEPDGKKKKRQTANSPCLP